MISHLMTLNYIFTQGYLVASLNEIEPMFLRSLKHEKFTPDKEILDKTWSEKFTLAFIHQKILECVVLILIEWCQVTLVIPMSECIWWSERSIIEMFLWFRPGFSNVVITIILEKYKYLLDEIRFICIHKNWGMGSSW